jgi:hypothetical protein
VAKCLTIENENLKVSQAALSTLVDSYSTLVEQLHQDKKECADEFATLQGITQTLHARFAAEDSAEVTQLREVVAGLSEKLKAAENFLALSTLDNFRRQQMCVSTGCQTEPEVAVAKMQNSPYLDRLQVHHLEVNDKMPWVQDLKEVQKEPVLKGLRAEVENLKNLGREWLTTARKAATTTSTSDPKPPASPTTTGSPVAVAMPMTVSPNCLAVPSPTSTPAAAPARSGAPMLAQACAVVPSLAPVAPANELRERLGQWWTQMTTPRQPTDAQIQAAAAAAASRTVDAAVVHALTFLAAKSKAVSFLAHAEATALSQYQTRANTERALVRLRLTLKRSSTYVLVQARPPRPPSDAQIQTAAAAAASRTVDAAVVRALTFLTTKAKVVSFLTHAEATALSQYRNRANADRALARLRLTLKRSSTYVLVRARLAVCCVGADDA